MFMAMWVDAAWEFMKGYPAFMEKAFESTVLIKKDGSHNLKFPRFSGIYDFPKEILTSLTFSPIDIPASAQCYKYARAHTHVANMHAHLILTLTHTHTHVQSHQTMQRRRLMAAPAVQSSQQKVPYINAST
jgi:hypothetical protein